MKTFYVKVGYTDATGFHGPGGTVNLPHDTDADIAAAQSMVAYGILSERAPDPEENRVASQPPASAPVPSAPQPEKPKASVRAKGGRRS